MTLQITMLLYSGRPNPQWTIEGAAEQELRRLLASSAIDAAGPVLPYRVGYRGFRIVDPATPEQPLLRVRGRSIPSFGFCGAPEIEEFLLHTGSDFRDPDTGLSLPFRPDVIFPTAPPAELRRVAPTIARMPSLAVDAPAWDSDDPRWMNHGPPNNFQWQNNCYNYATNLNLNNFAQIGANSLNKFDILTCVGAVSGVLSDGLRYTTGPEQALAAGEGHHVCLVIAPEQDFHWYRQDNDGGWSHKLGDQPITRLDAEGVEIIDPRYCSRGFYVFFAAWLRVPPGITI